MTRQHFPIRIARGGFTLVELLVSVALVLVIMSLFASAFQIATGTLLKHRGIAENDQRARAAVSMLGGDLEKRTYRQRTDVELDLQYPTAPGSVPEDPPVLPPFGQPVTDFELNLATVSNRLALGIVPLHPDYFLSTTRDVNANERGYFYYSENDPDNDVDDVLQFTVNAEITELGNEDQIPYTGRARPLSNSTWSGSPDDPDQPIWDDGIGFGLFGGVASSYGPTDTGSGESPTAEVSYFVRNGNLYRRVLLIRQPRFDAGTDDQPSDAGGTDFITGDYTTVEDLSPTAFGTSDFWNDFDFSATRIDPETATPPDPKMRFNTFEGLDNTITGAQWVSKYLALGNPQNRFGHDPSPRISVNGLQGRPKEHLDPSLSGTFIGRYTHEETSHPEFLFPGLPDPLTTDQFDVLTPFSPGRVYADTTPADGVPDLLNEGPRQAEDLLLPNVHAFDVKVWDDAIGQWEDMGHENAGVGGNVGDWHQDQVIDFGNLAGTFADTSGTPMPADYIMPPLHASATRAMYRYGSLDESEAMNVPPEFNRIFDTWHPGFDFDTANVPAIPSEAALDDPPPFRPQWSDRGQFNVESGLELHLSYEPRIWEPGTTYFLPNEFTQSEVCRVFPTHRPEPGGGNYPGHQSLFYQVSAVSGGGESGDSDGTTEPNWPTVAGDTVVDNEVTWKAFNNTIGLQAMQITIRFLDPTSQQMRQVSLVHSFVELD